MYWKSVLQFILQSYTMISIICPRELWERIDSIAPTSDELPIFARRLPVSGGCLLPPGRRDGEAQISLLIFSQVPIKSLFNVIYLSY